MSQKSFMPWKCSKAEANNTELENKGEGKKITKHYVLSDSDVEI